MRHVPTAVCAVLAAFLGVAVMSPETLERRPQEPSAGSASPPALQISGARPVLFLLDIHGPTAVKENSEGRLSLVARYSDETTADVTDRAEWSVDSPHAAVSKGVLTTFEVRRDERVTVTAWFADGLSLKASRTLTITDLPDASGLADGPPETRSRPQGAVLSPSREPSANGAEG